MVPNHQADKSLLIPRKSLEHIYIYIYITGELAMGIFTALVFRGHLHRTPMAFPHDFCKALR